MPETEKLIDLVDAITFNSGSYTQLRLREFTVGEWSAAETHKGMTRQMIALIVAVSGWPEPVVRKLPISAFNEASDYLSDFFVAGRRTGETSE